MHYLNWVCPCKNPKFNSYISARVKSVALRHVDLKRNPDTLLYTCVAAICELHDHKMLTDVGRPTADSCAVLLHGLKTMTTFIYHLSYTMIFNVFPLSVLAATSVDTCRCHADTVTTCKTWLWQLTDGWLPQRGGRFYLMCLQAAKQWPAAQEWISPFRGWQNNSLPVAIHDSWNRLAFTLCPGPPYCMAIDPVGPDWILTSFLQMIVNLNQPKFSKTGSHQFYIIKSICLWR